jgi:hypothetical protein
LAPQNEIRTTLTNRTIIRLGRKSYSVKYRKIAMAAQPEQKTMAERFVKSEILFKIPFSPNKEVINPINGNTNKLQIAIGP